MPQAKKPQDDRGVLTITRDRLQDTCAGTLTQVRQGVVRVRDNVRRRNVTVRAGGRYLARPRR